MGVTLWCRRVVAVSSVISASVMLLGCPPKITSDLVGCSCSCTSSFGAAGNFPLGSPTGRVCTNASVPADVSADCSSLCRSKGQIRCIIPPCPDDVVCSTNTRSATPAPAIAGSVPAPGEAWMNSCTTSAGRSLEGGDFGQTSGSVLAISQAVFSGPGVSTSGSPTGQVEATLAGSTLTIEDLVFQLPDQKILGVQINQPHAFLTKPFAATRNADGTYEAAAGAAQFLLVATVGPFQQGFRATNSTALTGFYDETSRVFSMSGTIKDSAGLATADIELYFQFTNLPPVAVATVPASAECTAPGKSRTHLSAANSTDPDGQADIRSYLWSIDSESAGGFSIEGRDVDVDLPLGSHTVDLLVVDQHGSYGSTRASVIAEDTTGPAFTNVVFNPSCLWPASHKYVAFNFGTDLTADVVDVCNPQAARVRVVSIVSNQPDNGTGDGDTANDIRSGEGGFCLRAERAGGGSEGRIYSITLEGVDGAGHKSQATVAISAGVAHDQRGQACPGLPLTAFVEDDDPRCSFPAEAPADSQLADQPALMADSEPTATEGCAAAPGTASVALALVLLLRARRSERRK